VARRVLLAAVTIGHAAHDLDLIFDSPHLQAVTDYAVLSSFLDGTVLVIDANGSHRQAVRQGTEALTKAGARVLGAVLNRVPARQRSDVGYTDYYGSEQRSPDAERKPESSLLPRVG
jgi:Mrp family chromosome partitioning ATPase